MRAFVNKFIKGKKNVSFMEVFLSTHRKAVISDIQVDALLKRHFSSQTTLIETENNTFNKRRIKNKNFSRFSNISDKNTVRSIIG